MTLSKGKTYLVLITDKNNKKTAWLVQQTAQKTWVATKFSEHNENYNEKISVIIGNSLVVADQLENMGVVQLRAITNTMTLRETMFNVLKYGRFI